MGYPPNRRYTSLALGNTCEASTVRGQVWPVALRNAVVNELSRRSRQADFVTGDAIHANNVLARSMRWLL
jgi:hypothetical protein